VTWLQHLQALARTGRGRFIIAFLAVQLLLPLHYYLVRHDPHDERFAWRMFSPMRMADCAVREPGASSNVCRVAATDPLNLVGVLSPGPRVPAILGNAVLYLDGQPVASLESGELVMRAAIPPGAVVNADLTYCPPPRPAAATTQAALPL
jgi:hypothetical protein